MTLPRFFVLASLLVVLFSLPGWPAQSVHAQGQSASVVQIYPVGTCCRVVNDVFSISIILTLAPGESINGFDVRINYTNPYTISNPASVLQAQSITYSSNLFSSYSANVLFECIDGVGVQGTNGCNFGPNGGDSPQPGQIHLAEVLLGQSISTGGLLFSATFSVVGRGSSIFSIDRANVINPNFDPTTQQLKPQYIPIVRRDGVFGNRGVVSFFNFQPNDTTVSPSNLPNQKVDFDATGIFYANNSTLTFNRYSWSFGDGTANDTSGPSPSHVFALPGNYSVSLTVWDTSGDSGTVTRKVPVSPALGNLLITVNDERGTLMKGNVIARIYNTSTSKDPIASKTTDLNGEVQFNKLTPADNYYVTFSGSTILNASATESVKPGWTTMDTVFMSPIPAPADYSGLIYLGSLAAGLGAVAAAIIYKKRPSRNAAPRKQVRGTGSRVTRRAWSKRSSLSEPSSQLMS